MLLTEKIFERIDGRSLELVFDIASGSVCAAFVFFEKNKTPKIMYKNTQDIKIDEKLSSDAFKKNTLIALNLTCKNLVEKGASSFEIKDIYEKHKNPKRAHIFFSSPWINTEIREIELEKDNGNFEKFIQNLFKRKEEENEKGLLISKEVNFVKVSGYELDLHQNHSVLNDEVKDLKISYSDTFINRKDLNNILSVIERNFSVENFFEYPTHKIINNSIRSLFDINKDYIFLDFTSEITDIFVTKDSHLSFFSSILFGRNTIYRELLKLNPLSTISQVKSVLNMSLSKHMLFNKEIESTLEKLHETFYLNLNTALSYIPKKDLPRDIFAIYDRENSLFLASFLRDQFPDKNLIFINEKKIKENISVNNDNYDNFIALQALYIK